MKTRRNGFTLTEMLVVLIIIGILAAMILPAAQKIQNRARNAGIQYEIVSLDAACRLFQQDVGSYPPDMYSVEGSARRAGRFPFGGSVPWIPIYNLGTLWGVPFHSAFYTYIEGTDSGSARQLIGWTSRCLVFFLGSKFTIQQKTYGPYYDFNPDQLYYDNITLSGSNTYGRSATGLGRAFTYQVDGIDNSSGRVVPTPRSARVYRYLDKFGLAKKNMIAGNMVDPSIRQVPKNFYIYDCYNGLDRKAPGGAMVNYDMHNKGEFDIFSYGQDGISALDNIAGTYNQAAIDALRSTVGFRQQVNLGAINDDLNNWSEAFRQSKVKPTQ